MPMQLPAVATVEVRMTASGDVSDYDDARQIELVAAFATTVAVPQSTVSLTVTSASFMRSLIIVGRRPYKFYG